MTRFEVILPPLNRMTNLPLRKGRLPLIPGYLPRLHNPNKGRLETLEVVFTSVNTTRLASCGKDSVTLIADWKGGLLITSGYDYPVYIYDVTNGNNS